MYDQLIKMEIVFLPRKFSAVVWGFNSKLINSYSSKIVQNRNSKVVVKHLSKIGQTNGYTEINYFILELTSI